MQRPVSSSRGFLLLEVVVALGLFALGVTAAIGMAVPLNRTIAAAAESAAASSAMGAVIGQIQQLPFGDGLACLKTAAQVASESPGPAYSSASDPQLFFASRDGMKFGHGGDAVWQGADAEKAWEVILIRMENLSPVVNDATAAFVAFQVRVRPMAGFQGREIIAAGCLRR